MVTIEARKQRWRNALKRDADPCLLYRIMYNPEAVERPDLWPDLKQERIDWAKRSYEAMVERCEWLDDDTLPHLEVATGTEIFAEAFGSPVHRAPGEMPFALPAAASSAEAEFLKTPEISGSSLSLLFEIADGLREEFGNDAVVKLPDVQSPMDIAALIVDKNQFYIDMITNPEAVKSISSRVKSVLIEFLDLWFARYGNKYVAHYPAYYMEGGMTLSEDEIGAVSGEIMAEFFLPELEEMDAHFGGIGIHCCADAHHHWAALNSLKGLRLLNLVQPVELVDEAYEVFGTRCLHYHQPQVGRRSVPWAERKRPPSNVRVVVEAGADSKDEARQLADELADLAGR